MSAQPPPLPRPNWWSRNWKWFVPVLAVTGLALFAGFIALFLSFVLGLMRSSEPYETAMARARADARVAAALGEPLKEGYFVTGTIDEGVQGSANLVIPVSGPRGKGQVFVVAHQELGRWRYETLAVTPNGQEPIHLLPSLENRTPPSGEDGGVPVSEP